MAYTTHTFGKIYKTQLEEMDAQILANAQAGGSSAHAGIIVDKNGNGDYTDLWEAVTYAKTIASETNPVSITIYPGVYDTGRGGSGFIITGDIHIRGVNRQSCVVTGTLNDAATGKGVFQLSGRSSLDNLTIINYQPADHPMGYDDDGNLYEWAVPNYCVHIDSTTNIDCRVTNCTLLSNQLCGLGIGFNYSSRLYIENNLCIGGFPFRRSTDPTTTVRDNGAIIWHTNSNIDNPFGFMRNNVFISRTNKLANISGNQQYLLAQNNLFIGLDSTESASDFSVTGWCVGSYGNRSVMLTELPDLDLFVNVPDSN